MSDKVALISVSLNKSAIGQFIKSLAKQSDKNFGLYVVDISGNDLEYENLPPETRVIKRDNKGYAFGVNEGIKEAIRDGFEKFCVINDDTYVDNDFATSVIKSIESHPRALIGGKIYYASGYEYHKDRYAMTDLGKVLWYAGGDVDWAHSQPKHLGVDEVDKKQFDKVVETKFITGCLMIFDKKVVDSIGFWDESYFLYYEDADYCERAKRAGLNLFYDPNIIIWHMISQSTGGSGSDLHRKYQRKNLVKFAMKYAPLRTKLHVVKNYLFG